MINFKSRTWSYGFVASLAIGLSGCFMEGQNPQHVDYSTHNIHKMDTTGTAHAKKAVKSNVSSSQNVPQKVVPGPKQTAAPQLPVIQ